MRYAGWIVGTVLMGSMWLSPALSVRAVPPLPLRYWPQQLSPPDQLPETEQPASPEELAYFEAEIRPLLIARCYSCHSARAAKREGGLTLDSREGWAQGGDNGPAIVPGDPDASRLIRAVRYTDPDLQMPPDKSLPAEAIAKLERWVRQGAFDPRTAADASPKLENPSDPVAGRDHWAFRPLAAPVVPNVAAKSWPRSSVDAFVLASLEAANLSPAPDADRHDLLRRVYVQLVGLPPTAEQVREFLADTRPDALERVVDRLLAQPQFGERWGRHWLDLARYADSNGLDENFLFREAWRYRNWVIEAVNADLPFDRFVLEQLAGDLLPFESIPQRDQQRIAAGFLVIGPKVLLGIDANRQKMDVADEQIETIGRAILGQTLGCARCHDHKFDPVPTADYYALAGIFTSTQVMEERYMLGQQRVMERLVGLGAEGDAADGAYETFWRELPALKERQKQAQAGLELLQKNENPEAWPEFANKHPEAVAEGAADAGLAIEERVAAQRALVEQLTATIAQPPAIPPRAMIPGDTETPQDEAIRLAGQFDRSGDVIPRGFLRVVGDHSFPIPAEQSGRLELGQWLTDGEHGAGRVAARVLANRAWHHLIGRGLVRTVDNFGRTGEPPTHPELLDHLARELIDSGWSLKHLVRTVILSRTFAQSSRHDEASHAIDPENKWLWRAHRRRLDPESLRDAMRLAAGELDITPRDSTVWYLEDQATAVGDNKNRRRTDFPCRSVYLPVIRNDLPELFDVFDFADPHATSGLRPQTMVATQGLFMLNDESVLAAADAIARRVLQQHSAGEPEQRVARMYELILGSPVDEPERAEVLAFVTAMEANLAAQGGEEAALRAWSLACQALLASSRFQVLD